MDQHLGYEQYERSDKETVINNSGTITNMPTRNQIPSIAGNRPGGSTGDGVARYFIYENVDGSCYIYDEFVGRNGYISR